MQVWLLLANNCYRQGYQHQKSLLSHTLSISQVFSFQLVWTETRMLMGIVFTSLAGNSPSRISYSSLSIRTAQHSSCPSSGEPGDEPRAADVLCTPRSWAAPASSKYIQLQKIRILRTQWPTCTRNFTLMKTQKWFNFWFPQVGSLTLGLGSRCTSTGRQSPAGLGSFHWNGLTEESTQDSQSQHKVPGDLSWVKRQNQAISPTCRSFCSSSQHI